MRPPAKLPLPPCGLYAITDGPRRDLVAACEAALQGSVALLQYRDKTAEHARRRREAADLAALCARFGVPLIVNDDVDLAAEIGAAGVHLGEDDGEVSTARARLGADALIGVSCYDSLERARRAAAAGADYLAFGAFFPSPTKPHARKATSALLHAAKPFGLPLVAIGGVTPDNAPQLIAAGADFVAAVSGVFGAADPAAAARRYAALFTT
ncbi:MAG TPA: thiamine phosphate synthase [Rudaea sp.]|nr:thiamine phosphate synthase [Rudaea sp.]